jgi:uncharacterized cupredoxin-like copper-binding protein
LSVTKAQQGQKAQQGMLNQLRRYGTIACLIGVSLVSLAGCGAPGPINVTMSDYAFKLSGNTAKEGKVTFKIVNSGAVTHEMVVEKTDLSADKLPQSADGTIDEEKLTSMGEQGDIETGKTVDLTLDMHPGTYMIICNLPGHFKNGMYTTLTVTP